MLTSAKDLPTGFGKAKSKDGKIVAAVAEGFAPVIREFVEAQLKPLVERIKELESRPTPEWCGAFAEGKQYRELSFTVHQGSLWIAKCTTSARPGNSADWTLCCKKGDHR